MLTNTILISVAGSLLCIDRICLQLMISRPIVTAPVIGLILGDGRTGLIIGAFLELLWVDRPALGNYIPPNDSLLAVVITAATILAGIHIRENSPNLMMFSLLVLLPVSFLSQKIDMHLTSGNDALSDAALIDAAQGNGRAIEKKHLLALGKTFVAYAMAILVFTTAGTWLLIGLFPLLPPAAMKTLQLLHFTFPLLVVAVTIHAVKLRRDIPVFCAIFVLAAFLMDMLHGL